MKKHHFIFSFTVICVVCLLFVRCGFSSKEIKTVADTIAVDTVLVEGTISNSQEIPHANRGLDFYTGIPNLDPVINDKLSLVQSNSGYHNHGKKEDEITLNIKVFDDGKLIQTIEFVEYKRDMLIPGDSALLMDVNFDNHRDIVIPGGIDCAHTGFYYDCYLWNEQSKTFVRDTTLRNVAFNPTILHKEGFIFSCTSSARSSYHTICEFIDGKFVETRNLRAECEYDECRYEEAELIRGKMTVIRKNAKRESISDIWKKVYHAKDSLNYKFYIYV